MPEYEGRYEANQAFLSEDRVHLRFVDFNNPLPVQNDKLYSGFTVSISDIGSGALCIKYFVYRFACRNERPPCESKMNLHTLLDKA